MSSINGHSNNSEVYGLGTLQHDFVGCNTYDSESASGATMSVSKMREMGYDDEIISVAMISANLDPDVAFQLIQGEEPPVERLEDQLPVHFVPDPHGSGTGHYVIRASTPASEMIQNNFCLRCLANSRVPPREYVAKLFKYFIILLVVIIGMIALGTYLARS